MAIYFARESGKCCTYKQAGLLSITACSCLCNSTLQNNHCKEERQKDSVNTCSTKLVIKSDFSLHISNGSGNRIKVRERGRGLRADVHLAVCPLTYYLFRIYKDNNS